MTNRTFTYEEMSFLLERYEAGETSLDEERMLKSYFNQPGIDERLRSWAPLFRALSVERAIVKPEEGTKPNARRGGGFSVTMRWMSAAAAIALLIVAWRLYSPVDPIANKPVENVHPLATASLSATVATVAPIPEKEKRPKQPILKKRKIKKIQTLPSVAPLTPNEIEDPEKALAEIKAALALVSSKMSKSRQELGKNLHHLEAMDEVIHFPDASH